MSDFLADRQAPTVADIQRAVGTGNPLVFEPPVGEPTLEGRELRKWLLSKPAQEPEKPEVVGDGLDPITESGAPAGEAQWQVEAQEPTKPASHTEGRRAIERGTCTIEPVANEADDVFGKMIKTIPGEKTEAQEVDKWTVKHVYDDDHENVATDDVFEKILHGDNKDVETEAIFDSMAQPLSNLEDEFKDDVLKSLHPSTGPLLKHLPRRNCIQFFRQSLGLVGLPHWSRWTQDTRERFQKDYKELAGDAYEVDQIVRHLQSFSVQYGKTRLLRMVATLLGMQAWMNMEVLDGSAD